ncbi:MAG: DUF1294 domain-containing protein [Clostridia bacterium]|nr:DUF1294 domain-containing protein [Clostridia bacterium]
MLAILWAVWLVINLVVFALYGIDKRRAKQGAWRIPEKTLLAGTYLLGGVGAFVAMHMFRHKTKHIAFQVSAPVGAALSLAVMAFVSGKLLGLI